MSDIEENKVPRATRPGKETPVDVKAAAVAGLLVGKTQSEVAEELGLSQPTVSRIDKSIPNEYREIIEDNRLQQYQVSISNLVQQNLEASLKATINIATLTGDEEWIQKQNARDLATLYGVTTDKIVYILRGLERAELAREERERERANRARLAAEGVAPGAGAEAEYVIEG